MDSLVALGSGPRSVYCSLSINQLKTPRLAISVIQLNCNLMRLAAWLYRAGLTFSLRFTFQKWWVSITVVEIFLSELSCGYWILEPASH